MHEYFLLLLLLNHPIHTMYHIDKQESQAVVPKITIFIAFFILVLFFSFIPGIRIKSRATERKKKSKHTHIFYAKCKKGRRFQGDGKHHKYININICTKLDTN